MKNSTALVMLIFAVVAIQSTQGRYLSRQKRVSDQRLAEIETLLALSKYRGLLSTVPVGFGRVDPNKLGRRRRAASRLWDLLDGDLEEDGGGVADAEVEPDADTDTDARARSMGRVTPWLRTGDDSSPLLGAKCLSALSQTSPHHSFRGRSFSSHSCFPGTEAMRGPFLPLASRLPSKQHLRR